MRNLFTTIILLLSLTIGSVAAQQKIASHPRLLLHKGDVTNMKTFAATNTNAQAVHSHIIAAADAILPTSPAERTMEGKRMLGTSREVLKRIFYLSYAYATTEDKRYAQRAEAEMLAVSEFEDWNPAHFLDVAEMTLAMAIGYDWLFDYLPTHSKSRIAMAIYEKGLKPAETNTNAWYQSSANNWNQVCNAAIVAGALSIYERDTELCDSLIAKAIESNRKALEKYAPDGGYPEGFGYWEYGTSYQAILAAVLDSALGNDGGISSSKGFMQSALWMNFMVAPSMNCYNFYDSHLKASYIPAKYWFARKLNAPELVVIDEQLLKEQGVKSDRLLPLYMIWASGISLSKEAYPSQNVWVSGGDTPLYIYRSGWQSPTDTYFAIKGGRAADSHGHIDAGSFIYEAQGIRWAVDLGVQDYNTLEQAGVDLWNMEQTSSRWELFRTDVASHNTLSLNAQRPRVDARAEIIASDGNSVVLDLSDVYADQAASVIRRAEIGKNGSLTIFDKIAASDKPLSIEWKMATYAEAELIGPNTIELHQDGKTLYIKLKGKGKITPTVWEEYPLKEYEAKDSDVRRVGFIIELKANTSTELEVTLTTTRSKMLKTFWKR
ncbi:MAG: heparinase [Rikenellaceae bacterium]|nr:heparinase [Rikenellaceae bacterium]